MKSTDCSESEEGWYTCLHSEDPWLHSWRANTFILVTCFPLCRQACLYLTTHKQLYASYFSVLCSRLPTSFPKPEASSCKWNWFERHCREQLKASHGSSNVNDGQPWPQRNSLMVLLWVQVTLSSLFCSHMLCSQAGAQAPSPCASLLPHASCKLSALSVLHAFGFVQPYVYFRGLSGEDIFTPIKLINSQRARYSFSNWHNSVFADLAAGGERERPVN